MTAWLLGAGLGVGFGWAQAGVLRRLVHDATARGRVGLLLATGPLRVLAPGLGALWLGALEPVALVGGMMGFWCSSRLFVRKEAVGGRP